MKYKSGLVFGDTHFKHKEIGDIGGQDDKTWEAFLKYVKDHRYDEVIHLGDIMDFPYLNKKSTARDVENQRIQKCYNYANKQLTRFTDAIYRNNAKAKIRIIEGNHDHWIIDNLYAAQPLVIGTVPTVDKGLFLKGRGIQYIPYWTDHKQFVQIGKAIFIHGLYVCQNHPKKHFGIYGENSVFYGHLHDEQCYTPITVQDDKPVVQSIGCLASYDQPYLKGRPTNWRQSIAEFEFYPDGKFSYRTIKIFDHQIREKGKVYG